MNQKLLYVATKSVFNKSKLIRRGILFGVGLFIGYMYFN